MTTNTRGSTAHTAGPWAAGMPQLVGKPRKGTWEISADRGGMIAYGIKSYADARLIAAAPQLLEALRALRDSMQTFEDADDTRWTDEDQAALEQARAAIKAAEGE